MCAFLTFFIFIDQQLTLLVTTLEVIYVNVLTPTYGAPPNRSDLSRQVIRDSRIPQD